MDFMRAEAKFIEPRFYPAIVNFDFDDTGITVADLKRIAPDGEYCGNLIARLPHGAAGEQARIVREWIESGEDL